MLLAATLIWQHPDSEQLETIVEKTISGNCSTGFFEVSRTGTGVTLWPDDLAHPGDCYRVKVFNDEQVAPYSNTAQVPAEPKPVKPPKPCRGKKC